MTSLLAIEGVGTGGTGGAVDALGPAAAPGPVPRALFAAALDGVRAERAPSVGTEFEAATLTTFLQALLPPESSPTWGGSAGAMWRGLFAETLAADLAESGGIGIAATIDKSLGTKEDGK